jgi:hypothetical protein
MKMDKVIMMMYFFCNGNVQVWYFKKKLSACLYLSIYLFFLILSFWQVVSSFV